ncbi:MAG: 4-(cytidine 5'-diphospho)-2-C-methyl-D-erythritol kinase [Bacillota bacterium]
MSVVAMARAKVNLALEIVGRRPDGYHDLITVLQAIGLEDRLTFRPRAEGISLTVTGPWSAGVPVGEGNLVRRAAELLRRESGCGGGAEIVLEKRIPAGAGLGGGSSDAAAALICLAHLWGVEASPDRLAALGARLGADVPFFVGGHGTCLARGRGDVLEPLPELGDVWLAVAFPGLPQDTARAYAHYDLQPPGPPTPAAPVVEAIKASDRQALCSAIGNALRPAVVSLRPDIEAVLKLLRDSGALAAELTGSGSAVFAVSPDQAGAVRLRGRLERAGLAAWAVPAMARTISWGQEREVYEDGT